MISDDYEYKLTRLRPFGLLMEGMIKSKTLKKRK